ncbi:MAG: exonuclease SbcCD subunit D [Chloroflexi bacterium]|nr:exonuclease SbcCD subunit D [Chloroflexota bacterium]
MAAGSIRILHFADIHIGIENYGTLDPNTGVNSRVLDFLRRFDDVVNYALGNEVDAVIFAGDAFKNRDPNSTYRREFAKRIKRIANTGVPIVLLVGNHDLPTVHLRASSVEIFRTLDVPNVIVADVEKIHLLQTRRGPLQVVTVPYPIRSRLLVGEEYRGLPLEQVNRTIEELVVENIGEMAARLDTHIPAVLAGHFTVAGSKFGSERKITLGYDPTILLSAVNDPAFDYVALGHIHKHQELNKGAHPPVVYAGSIERVDFGEEREQKGFVVADVWRGGSTYTFVPTAARVFRTVELDLHGIEGNPLAFVEAEMSKIPLENAVVRVLVTAPADLERPLVEREIRSLAKGAAHLSGITWDTKRNPRAWLAGDEHIAEMSPQALLRRYLELKEEPPERIAPLMERAEALITAENS